MYQYYSTVPFVSDALMVDTSIDILANLKQMHCKFYYKIVHNRVFFSLQKYFKNYFTIRIKIHCKLFYCKNTLKTILL